VWYQWRCTLNLKKIASVFLLLTVVSCIAAEATSNEEVSSSSRWLRVQPSARHAVDKKLKEQKVGTEYERVNWLYQKVFGKEEREVLNKVCWESYAAAYYQELNGFSHTTEVEHLREEAEKRLKKLKRGKAYAKILMKTRGSDKQHLLQYIARRTETGKIDAIRRNAENSAQANPELQPEHLFYRGEGKTRKPLPAPSGKVLLASLLASAAILLIIGLVGACVCPQLPMFQGIRALLES